LDIPAKPKVKGQMAPGMFGAGWCSSMAQCPLMLRLHSKVKHEVLDGKSDHEVPTIAVSDVLK
jgi:hypothetical protein